MAALAQAVHLKRRTSHVMGNGLRPAVFIPAYNDASTIAEVIAEARETLSNEQPYLLVVDDASIDGTAQIAKEHADHVIVHEQNKGVGSATKTGLCHLSELGGFEFVLKLDADKQHLPTYLKTVMAELRSGARIVVCSRFHEKSVQVDTPDDRVLLNNMLTNVVSQITGWRLTDARSGFMGFRFEDIQKIAPAIIVERYGIPMELILRAWKLNPHSAVVEIAHPAMYGLDISEKLNQKYTSEEIEDQSQRLKEGYAALLKILTDIGVSRTEIREAFRAGILTQTRDSTSVASPLYTVGRSEMAVAQ